MARQYLELRNYDQARTEARILRERWPQSPEADEAQLLTAQAWALEQRTGEALGAFQAAIDRKPRPEVAALANDYRAALAEYLWARERAGVALVSKPGLFDSTSALVNSTLRRLKTLDDRRQRLWNPASIPVAGKAAPRGPGQAGRETALPGRSR